MMETLGLYIHVPFCQNGKCPYCDFYSVMPDGQTIDAYCIDLKERLAYWAGKAAGQTVDTVYFGGGTPSLLNRRLADILNTVKTAFSISTDAEITFEANPSLDTGMLPFLREAGFNRLSLGMQSADPTELRLLGRRHTPEDVKKDVYAAKDAGLRNISLDLMLSVPGQDEKSLLHSVEFAAGLGVTHVSAYLLKIEPGTAYYKNRNSLSLPDEETETKLYYAACEALERYGYRQYEISNFAKSGFESRHNLKYWNCEEYIGVGPAAHSYFNGRRFYYNRSLRDFTGGALPADDGEGGSFEEYVMLRLRLSDGLYEAELKARFGRGFEALDQNKLALYKANGLIGCGRSRIALTRRGFLLSNSIIAGLLFG